MRRSAPLAVAVIAKERAVPGQFAALINWPKVAATDSTELLLSAPGMLLSLAVTAIEAAPEPRTSSRTVYGVAPMLATTSGSPAPALISATRAFAWSAL